MAKLRRNHNKAKRSGFAGLMGRVVVFFLFCAVVFVYLYKLLNQSNSSPHHVAVDTTEVAPSDGKNRLSFLPSSTSGQIVHHKYYSLSYLEDFEQAEWVAYPLTKESIRKPNVPRSKRFNTDPLVKTGSATHYDYKGSMMTRGHLAPAGDMAFSTDAMQESFYMSNMSPQTKEFNEGLWLDLEKLVRDWAWNEKEILVITGPILDNVKTWIGKKNQIAVPRDFYKVILTNGPGKQKAIALIIPHAVTDGSLSKYVVSIDEVERRTGIDFFVDWLEDAEENELEAMDSGKGFSMKPNKR